MLRKIAYWGATALVAIVTLFAGFSYLTTAPRRSRNSGTSDIPSSCVSSRHREAGRSHRAASATAAELEGMGVRRLYFYVDRGSRGALSGGGREVLAACRVLGSLAVSYVTRSADRGGSTKAIWRSARPARPLPSVRRLRAWRRRSSARRASRRGRTAN